jgi:hypothetical protein
VIGYQTQILAEGQWPIAKKWTEGEHALAQRVILDPKETFLMEDADAQAFYARCEQERSKAGLSISKEGNCPLLERQNIRIQAENLLLQEMGGVAGLKTEGLRGLLPAQCQKAIDLMLRMLAPFVDPHARFGIPKTSPAS